LRGFNRTGRSAAVRFRFPTTISSARGRSTEVRDFDTKLLKDARVVRFLEMHGNH
jgi:hypothetical protein